ncbi:MaoC family dehydratase [Massilia sp. MB5]|uniref:MaoC family dehydratase n=1 Tax=unclassified Massilia TaxID=2609279 RepID=UPI00067DDE57|nr:MULTISPECIES: MaoC family dehydratase [unclassified Massilia]AKU21379.1 dehydratase [Massilia sp. NR 4-1]UMR29063.1 MaoC family dehydratase [Massilia sp. MB5]
MRVFANLAEMQALAGQEVAVSDWIEVTQERIDRFAEATGDHQWIHVDAERAARESPYGATVAHGFLTLALLPAMLQSSIRMADVSMGLNYGLNKVRFPAPLTAGGRVRGRFSILSVAPLEGGGAQVEWGVSMEAVEGGKPVCVAEFLMRRYP